MNVKLLHYALFLLPLILDSCFTSSALQTAKPLDKGTGEFSCGLLGFSRSGGNLPGINTMLRVGLGRKSDIGLGYSLGIGHLRLDYKYNFYRSADENRFLSTGLGFEYFFTDEENLVPAVSVPLYFSMNHTGKVVPYFMQRYTFGLTDPDVAFGNHGEGYHTMFYTGGAGIRYGKNRVKGYFEVSYSVDRVRDRFTTHNAANEEFISDNAHESAGVEVNVGVSFTFGGRKKK